MRYEVVGPLARCMADAVAMAEALGQPDPRDPDSRRFAGVPLHRPPRPCRVLYVPRFGDHPVDARIAALTGQAAQGLRALGHTVETAQAFDLADEINAKWSLLSQAGLAWLVEQGGGQLPFCPPLDAGKFGAATQANASAASLVGARCSDSSRCTIVCTCRLSAWPKPTTACLIRSAAYS